MDKTHANWIHIQNPFWNQTQDSRKDFNVLTTDHVSKLRAVLGTYMAIDSAYNAYLPLHQAFTDLYLEYTDLETKYHTATAFVDRKFADLQKLRGRWEAQVRVVYYTDTVEYNDIFPDGLEPLYSSGREAKIKAVKSLAIGLSRYPSLNALQMEVEQFYNDMLALRDAQQQLEKHFEDVSVVLTKRHKDAAECMFRNLGALILVYGASIEVTTFFEMSIIRTLANKKGSTDAKGSAKNAETAEKSTADHVETLPDTGTE